MNKKITMALIGCGLFSMLNIGFADTLVNKVEGLFDAKLVPVSPADQSKLRPVLCLQDKSNPPIPYGPPIAYGEQHEFNWTDPKVKNYLSMTLRMGGCQFTDTYLGYIGLDNSGKLTYSGPTDNKLPGKPLQPIQAKLTVTQSGGTYTLKGNLYFKQLTGNDNLPPAPSRDNWFTGINLSGLEFSNTPNAAVIPDISNKGPDAIDTLAFLNTKEGLPGANTVRIPVRWAYMQPYGSSFSTDDPKKQQQEEQAFNDYFGHLVLPTVKTLVDQDYYVMIDLHSYMHYATVGTQHAGCLATGNCPDGTLDKNPQDYIGIWTHIWHALKTNIPADQQKYLMFDLVNEPTAASQDPSQQLSAQEVASMEMAVIAALEKDGFVGHYLVEGEHFTGLHSWDQYGNNEAFSRANMTGLLQENGLSSDQATTTIKKIIINVHQYLDSDYSGTHNDCLQDLTTTGKNGFNLQAFVDYLRANKLKAMVTEFGVGDNKSSCAGPLNDFLKYLNDHAYSTAKGYGFVGWTAWSTGHGWGSYNLRITPSDSTTNNGHDNWKGVILRSYFHKH